MIRIALLIESALACAAADIGGSRREMTGPIPAELIRIIDGDTIEVRAKIWLEIDITTRVRLAGIDAPELNGACAEERRLAEIARSALAEAIGVAPVWLANIRHDKYGGRVIAEVLLADGRNASAVMLATGVVVEWESTPPWCRR